MIERSCPIQFLVRILAAVMILSIAGCGAPSTGGAPQRNPAAPTMTYVPTIALPTNTPTQEPTPTLIPSPAPSDTPVASPTPAPATLIGAGDIAYCGNDPGTNGDEQTADLIGKLLTSSPDATIMTVGDTVYGDGTTYELNNCFGPSWGRYKERIRPAPGNHDYMTDQGAPYFNYFGDAAGPAGIGYYSYDLGSWHIVALNTNCNDVACGPNSEQVKWFREDLQSHPNLCTLVYYHHPRYSSGIAGGTGTVNPLWRVAYEGGVDVVVNGHDHDYERFAPMNTEGQPDPNGVRAFVVGTGGAVLRTWGTIKPNSEVRYDGTYGVIQFKLYPEHYEWTFFPTTDAAQTDTGSTNCH